MKKIYGLAAVVFAALTVAGCGQDGKPKTENAMDGFREIAPAEVDGNFIDLIGNQWMLITAGDSTACNTMTASWGGVGEMWGRNMAMCVIRPQRHTHKFTEEQDRLTLSFFGPEYRKALSYCGSRSGRDEDKITNAGLSVAFTGDGVPAIAEAQLILQCRKMYVGEFDPDNFVDKEIAAKWYPQEDYHTVYICEIEKAYVK